MTECDADGRKADASAGQQSSPADNAYLKQPLNDATLDALHKLVARGGVSGNAAQEMLDAELLGADDVYAARLRGRPSPPAAPASSWRARLITWLHAWRKKR